MERGTCQWWRAALEGAKLQAPIKRLAGLDIPIPYNRTLEYHTVPQVENIIEAARELVEG